MNTSSGIKTNQRKSGTSRQERDKQKRRPMLEDGQTENRGHKEDRSENLRTKNRSFFVGGEAENS